MYLEKFIKYVNILNSNIDDKNNPNNTNIEFELKLLLDPRNKYPGFIKIADLQTCIGKCKQFFTFIQSLSDIREKQTINFIKNENDTSYIKELHFINGIQITKNKRFYSKKRIHDPIYICRPTDNQNFKLSISSESDSSDVNGYDLIRFKQRFTFDIGDWNVDFTFVKTSTSKNVDHMKEIRDKLFVNTNHNTLFTKRSDLWAYADRIEIEFEYNSTEELTLKSIKDITRLMDDFNTMYQKKNSNDAYTSESFLEKLKSIIDESDNAGNIAKYKNKKPALLKNTIKKILPNAIEINKKQYFEELLPNIANFYITDKADGMRSILLISDYIYVYNTELTVIKKNNHDIKETIVECEMVGDQFYAFDIIQYDGVNIATNPFKMRLESLQKLAGIWDILKIKEFKLLTEDNYANVIQETIKSTNKDYEMDGVIFTSANAKYKLTKFYKWKDINNMTIDFTAKKCPPKLLGISPYVSKSGFDLYILFSGIATKEYKKLNLSKIQYYNTMFLNIDRDYFPVQFAPSDNSLAYLYWHPQSGENIDGKVIELRYITKSSEWDLVRVRNDRVDDFKKKKYFGNHYKVAELIWRNYSNPLTIDILCSKYKDLLSDFYFKKHDSEDHKAIRKFNNMVKNELIKRYSNQAPTDSWAIDLGCGKGQDLLKYASADNISNVLFIDSNENNLCNVIERKNTFVSSKTMGSLGVFIQNLNLLDSCESNLERIKKSFPFLQRNKVRLIVCNFAIHYFCQSVEKIDNLVNLINSLLSPNGRFIFTCLHGEKVYELLYANGKPLPWDNGKRYWINPMFKNKIFKGGEEIEILLPFDDTPNKEYLVNFNLVKRRLERKKIKHESTANFGELYLDSFEKDGHYKLDHIDKEYIKLLYFSVFYKH